MLDLWCGKEYNWDLEREGEGSSKVISDTSSSPQKIIFILAIILICLAPGLLGFPLISLLIMHSPSWSQTRNSHALSKLVTKQELSKKLGRSNLMDQIFVKINDTFVVKKWLSQGRRGNTTPLFLMWYLLLMLQLQCWHSVSKASCIMLFPKPKQFPPHWKQHYIQLLYLPALTDTHANRKENCYVSLETAVSQLVIVAFSVIAASSHIIGLPVDLQSCCSSL